MTFVLELAVSAEPAARPGFGGIAPESRRKEKRSDSRLGTGPPPGTVASVSGGDEEVALLGSVLDRLDGDETLGLEAADAIRRGCRLLLRAAHSCDASGKRLVAERIPLLVAGIERVVAIERKRDQRAPARALAREVKTAVRQWEVEREKTEATEVAKFYGVVWDAVHTAWKAVLTEFKRDPTLKRSRSKASFVSVRDAARDRFRRVVEDQAREFQSNEPEHIVVGGEAMRDQLLAAAKLDVEDILLGLYFPARRASHASGFDNDDLRRYDAVVRALDDGSSGFGPVAAAHVTVGKVLNKSANTVEKAELLAKRGAVLPPLSGEERGEPEDPCCLVQRRRVGSLRRGGLAERRPVDD